MIARAIFFTVSAAFLVLAPEWAILLPGADCNRNGVEDAADLSSGSSRDCNGNGVPDECDLVGEGFSFRAAVELEVGGGVEAIDRADLDSDGDLDLIAVKQYEDSVVVLWNLGGGKFSAPMDLPAGSRPVHVIAIDVDGQGFPDLVIANRGERFTGTPSTVTVIRNLGDGEFAPPASFTAGIEPVWVAAADLDGDGDQDVIAANLGITEGVNPGSISVLMNDGKVGFSPPVNYSAGSNPTSVVAADFDGDSDPDLAAASLSSSPSVFILINRGNGTFAGATQYQGGSGLLAIAGADFDGDGDVDLATANLTYQYVALLWNNGNGTFHGPDSFQTILAPLSVHPADLDGDGRMDLAVAPGVFQGVSVFWGRQGIPFSGKDGFRAGSVDTLPVSVTSGDLDGDSLEDLITANGESGTVSILFNRGARTFDAVTDYEISSFPVSLVTGDFDGDSRLDIATASPGPNNSNGSLSLVKGNGDGTFEPPSDIPLVLKPLWITAADLDGDGNLDLCTVGASRELQILRNRGNGSFSSPEIIALKGIPTCVVASLLDDDSAPDLAVSYGGIPATAGSDVAVLLNQGEGSFASEVDYPVGERPLRLDAGDLDGDGDVDLAVARPGSSGFPGREIVVLRNRGNGTFEDGMKFSVGEIPLAVVIADLDANGALDIATANESGSVTVLWNDGRGGFGNPLKFAVRGSPVSLTAGDLDGDSYLDIAALKSGDLFGGKSIGGGLAVLLNDRTGSFRQQLLYSNSIFPAAIDSKDFDGDGKLDLALVGYFTMTLLINDTDAAASLDCNRNQRPDECEIADGTGSDLNGNGVLDGCENDCDQNGRDDALDISSGLADDCNHNRIPDDCDLTGGSSKDIDDDGVPDECEYDCNGNEVPDVEDVDSGTSEDCNRNWIPDECDIAQGRLIDANQNDIPDPCERRNRFHRGDPNQDDITDISDGVMILDFLFLGGESFDCAEAADANNDGEVDLSDAVFLFGFLFLGTEAPPSPGPPPFPCSTDPDAIGSEGDLGCDFYAQC